MRSTKKKIRFQKKKENTHSTKKKINIQENKKENTLSTKETK